MLGKTRGGHCFAAQITRIRSALVRWRRGPTPFPGHQVAYLQQFDRQS
jgi:hypothetical protein